MKVLPQAQLLALSRRQIPPPPPISVCVIVTRGYSVEKYKMRMSHFVAV